MTGHGPPHASGDFGLQRYMLGIHGLCELYYDIQLERQCRICDYQFIPFADQVCHRLVQVLYRTLIQLWWSLIEKRLTRGVRY
jgi:hypothetical protein